MTLSRLKSLALAAALAGLTGLPNLAVGQSAESSAEKPAVLIADSLQVQGRNVLIATGNIEVFHGERRLKARKITFDRQNDLLTIEGPITLTDGAETVILADSAELDPSFQNGLMTGARMIFEQRAQLAARQLSRIGGRYSQLYKVAATSCRVCNSDEPPLWQIRATKTTHDAEARQLYFENAQLRIWDVPVFWLPRLRLPDPTLERATGFLIPSLKQNSQLGFGVKIPYFIRMGDHRDLTVTPYVSGNTTTLELRYRQAFHTGRVQLDGALSQDNLRSGTRGYLFGSGHFDLARDFKLDLQVEAVTDSAYLLDYDYSSKDRLESEIAINRVKRDEYIRAGLVSYQTLREDEDNATLPTIIGTAEYERVIRPASLRGTLHLNAGFNSLYRYSNDDIVGRDVTRTDVSLHWRKNWTLPFGLRAEYAAGLAADGFLVSQDSTSQTESGSFTPETQITLRWPLAKRSANGATHLLEPVAMVGWVGGSNAAVPNEESTRVEYDGGNLLSLSRFTEVDRRERGMLGAVGLNWTRLGPSGDRTHLTIGQVYREHADNNFSASSGLSGTSSDLLVSGYWQTSNGLSFAARTLFDDGLRASKAEARAEWVRPKTGLSASYIWLGADPMEDRAATVSEWLLDGHYRFSRHWTGSAAWRYDVASNELAESQYGVTYRNECVDVNLSLSRRFTSSTIVDPSTSLDFTVNLTGFSAGKTDNSYTRRCRN